MALDLWFQEDVTRVLASVCETMRCASDASVTEDAAAVRAYQQGFEDALQSIAVAFGIRPPGHTRRGAVAAAALPVRRIPELSDGLGRR